MSKSPEEPPEDPNVVVSLIPIILLILMLSTNVIVFKQDATSGPNQIALLIAAAIAAFIACFHLKIPYQKIENKVIKSVSISISACLILLIVGSLISTWIMGGIVPTIIYYGLNTISPRVFLPVTCIICTIVSMTTGSSWTTTSTIGVALIGIGNALQIPAPQVAGAIISGAYFGDKMSPLSDTSNLAPAVAGSELFEHIRHMTYSSVPGLLIAMLLFAILGSHYSYENIDLKSIAAVTAVLKSSFNISPWNFIPPLAVFLLVRQKIAAIPVLSFGVLIGAVWIFFFQPQLILLKTSSMAFDQVYQVLFECAFQGFKIETSNQMVNELLSRGGMTSMLPTVWLVVMAMMFGGTMEASGMLKSIARTVLMGVRSAAGLITATVISCIFLNITASDQYLAVVVPGRMFRQAYRRYDLHPKNLSRALEDAGTMTSPLVPWNSCGAYQSSILGVATLDYLPFCFFNFISPLVSIFLAQTGISIAKIQRSRQLRQSPGLVTVPTSPVYSAKDMG